MRTNYTPMLDTQAGSCLTTLNWQEIGAQTASYSLEALLVKPGSIALLKQISSLKAFLAWPGTLILNAMNFAKAKQGVYTLISPYDGSKVAISYAEFAALIKHLHPDAVVLPKDFVQEYREFWTNWDESVLPFISADVTHGISSEQKYGVYFKLEENAAKIQHFTGVPKLVAGDIGPELIRQLSTHQITYVETDQPAHLAMQGKVYSESGILDLTKNEFREQFTVIASNCSCSTCSQQLTKAYLHHLLAHTPLLCQRFLIQHNAYYSFTF